MWCDYGYLKWIGQCIQQTVKTNFADSMQKYWYEKRDQAR